MKKWISGFIFGTIMTIVSMIFCNVQAENITKSINIVINKINISVNTKSQKISSIHINGTNYVPIRVITEAFGADCEWDSKTNTVNVYTKDVSPKSYLESKGYKVLTYEGSVPSYTLTKDKLTSLPYMLFWGLQNTDISPYLEKTVYTEKYLVKNHPLDNWEMKSNTGITKSKGNTLISLFIVDEKIIGGISNPNTDSTLAGGGWSLEGKTIDELHPNYQDWYDNWVKKYKP